MNARPLYVFAAFALAACSSGSDATTAADAGSDGATNPNDATSDSAAPNDTGSGGDDSSAIDDTAVAVDDSGTSPNDSGATGDSTTSGDTGSGTTLVNPPPGSKFFVGANFWNVDWEGADDFFVPGTNFATTTNPWQPQLLKDLAPYHVLRFMDWNQTNDANNPQAVWTTRKQKTQSQSEPVAFEWQIDLCNRTKKDYWLNVPHEASPDYWKNLAQLVHDQLDPSLRVYLEWSNEVWNGGFPQNGYAANQGKSLKLPGDDAAASYYVYESVRVYEAFESVFGKGSPRVVKVLSGQAAWTGPCGWDMTALADKTINPNGTMPDVYAIAPYFSGNSTGALQSSIPQTADWVKQHITCAAAEKLPVISYEGGADSFAAGSGCTTIQHDAKMHDIYESYLDGLSGAGLKGPFMQYTHTGSCWGLKEKTSDTAANSPKYQGVLDWLAAHP